MKIDKIEKKFNQVAEKYDLQRRYMVPCYNEFYGTISFIAGMRSNFRSILDLGAGTGLLTKYLYKQFPDATYTLVDISDQMLDKARQRFAGLNNINYEIYDYSVKFPSATFDLIASALSIHYLENEDKTSLFINIHKQLKTGGYFVHLDRFRPYSEYIEKNYINWRYNYIVKNTNADFDRESFHERQELTTENTINDTRTELIHIGFKIVECIYSFMNYGVILAIK